MVKAPFDATVTELLHAWQAGEEGAADRLLPHVYDELRRLASGYFRRERRHLTLQATAVVHEAYLRLVEQSGVELVSRAHFLGLAARVMRRVLVDHARERGAGKRGGKAWKVSLTEAAPLAEGRPPDMIALDDALRDLAARDAEKAAIVELRFFGGLTLEETAEVLGISPATVVRQWRRAKAWLFHQLSQAP